MLTNLPLIRNRDKITAIAATAALTAAVFVLPAKATVPPAAATVALEMLSASHQTIQE